MIYLKMQVTMCGEHVESRCGLYIVSAVILRNEPTCNHGQRLGMAIEYAFVLSFMKLLGLTKVKPDYRLLRMQGLVR